LPTRFWLGEKLRFLDRALLADLLAGTNLEQPDGSRSEKKELLWGDGSGVAAATTADYGDVVLAEYTQRTSCERINSQAKELGIERPRVRNGRSIANLCSRHPRLQRCAAPLGGGTHIQLDFSQQENK
jgi:hypothetical protein